MILENRYIDKRKGKNLDEKAEVEVLLPYYGNSFGSRKKVEVG